MSNPLLPIALEASVRLRMIDISKAGRAHWERSYEANRDLWLTAICEKGDILQYGGGKKGEVADVFNKTAAALAHLAFVPGGVKFAGSRYVGTFEEEDVEVPECPS